MYEKFEKIRNAAGYKNADVAKNTGINANVFSDWKAGRYQPKIDKMLKIAAFLKCDVMELL